MVWLKLLIILLLSSLSIVVAVAAPTDERKPTPMTLVKLRGEINASVDRALETLREEIKQSQEQTEARLSAALIKPLDKRINTLEESRKDAPPWWLPIFVSTILATVLGFSGGRLAASRDKAIANNERKFARSSFKLLKDSLLGYLTNHAIEIKVAESIADNVMESHFIRPVETWSKEETEFPDRGAYFRSLKELDVSTFELNFPDEGKQYTRLLANLFEQHQRGTRELKRRLGEFYRLVRALSVDERPDKELLAKYGVDSVTKLPGSVTYQRDLEAARDTIKTAAGEPKRLKHEIEKELVYVENLVGSE